MKEEHFVSFWSSILQTAIQQKGNTVVIKPKGNSLCDQLSDGLKKEYLAIWNKVSRMENVYFIDKNRWCFIEAIGVSDIAVSQGMTTSSTVAIICGIEGLYLDQFGYEHPFSKSFKDRIVFDDPRELTDMIDKIVTGQASPLGEIPEELLREFDEYSDDRGIDLIKDILLG
jgi:hypothetical protein